MVTGQDTRWDLGKLYASTDDPRIRTDLEAVRGQIKAFKQTYEGQLASLSAAALRDAIEAMEGPSNALERLAGYAWMEFYTDTRVEASRALYQSLWSDYTLLLTEFEFFKQELKYLDHAHFAGLLAAPELAPYRYYLERVRMWTPHTLPLEQEALLVRKNITGERAWSQLYTEMTASLKFLVHGPDGPKEMGIAEARGLRTSSDRAVRKSAHEAWLAALGREGHVFGTVFNTLMQDHLHTLELRKVPDLMGLTLLEHDLSREVIDALLTATEAHYPLVQRYYTLKAKLLGYTDLASHDLMAPLGAQAGGAVPFDTAKDLVISTLNSFTPRFGELAKRFFSEQYIDPFPTAGKPMGAFCFGLGPSVHPFIFMNYGGSLHDITTLAHELGHGLHYVMAAQRQTLLNTYTVAPLLETVSIFSETHMYNILLARETDARERIQLLASQLEGAIASISRQVMYTRWELRAYDRRKQGIIPVEELCTMWLEELRNVYGDTVRFSELDQWGWLTNPFFITQRFVCYSYAFGQLLVYALYQQYREDGRAFVEKYLAMLELGGSVSPHTLLAGMGLDIADPDFWEQGFVIVEDLLDKLAAAVAAVQKTTA
ncbi:MAG: oligoendopeptidase pepF/M3 family [Cyanobacteria bacterium RYN_339]|nr:oligoendopeptidase pepF/M3 family [Cyanobacteria bacterium RYN_339]